MYMYKSHIYTCTCMQWVISLYKSTHSNFLVAGCQNGVYILDCKVTAPICITCTTGTTGASTGTTGAPTGTLASIDNDVPIDRLVTK